RWRTVRLIHLANLVDDRKHLVAFMANEVVADILDARELALVGIQTRRDCEQGSVLDDPAARFITLAGALFAPGGQFLQRGELARIELPAGLEVLVVLAKITGEFTVVLQLLANGLLLQPGLPA